VVYGETGGGMTPSDLLDSTDYYISIKVYDGYEWNNWLEVKFHMNTIPETSYLYVEGFAPGTSDILNITNHTPTFNWTYNDNENSAQTQWNLSVWTDTGQTGTLMWYKNETDANITILLWFTVKQAEE
jgi:hypothetical protein